MKILFAIAFCIGSQAFAANCVSATGNGGSTGALNTTGASLLTVALGDLNLTVPAVSDSAGNTWNRLTISGGNAVLFYSYAKGAAPLSLGTMDVVTVTGTAFPAFTFCSWSGTLAYPANPFVAENTGMATSTTVQPGAVTPSSPALLITVLGANTASAPYTVDSGFSAITVPFVGGSNFGEGMGFLLLGVPASTNPTWTVGSSATIAASIAVFSLSGGGMSQVVLQ